MVFFGQLLQHAFVVVMLELGQLLQSYKKKTQWGGGVPGGGGPWAAAAASISCGNGGGTGAAAELYKKITYCVLPRDYQGSLTWNTSESIANHSSFSRYNSRYIQFRSCSGGLRRCYGSCNQSLTGMQTETSMCHMKAETSKRECAIA